MGVFKKIQTVFFLFFMALTFSHCFFLPECQDFDCPDGQSCIVQDDQAVCSGSSGDNNTDTGNVAGEACDTDSDCVTGLVCLPDLDGIDVCSEP